MRTHAGTASETLTVERTDLKSPSTSESSQMSSWGTFLLFRRCSSLLFCGWGKHGQYMYEPAEIHDNREKNWASFNTFIQCEPEKLVISVWSWQHNITNVLTFLSSTTTSVLCLLIVCGRDRASTLHNEESQPASAQESDTTLNLGTAQDQDPVCPTRADQQYHPCRQH